MTYARPVNPGEPREGYAHVYDLQIWPNRFENFESRGLNWMDYIYEPWPWVRREIVLDAWEPEYVPEWVREACLVFPNGYSQRNPPDPRNVILQAHKLFPASPVVVVGKKDLGCFELTGVCELVDWLAAAKCVLTVNTAASILASAVRDSWHHIPDLDPRHDWQHPRRKVVERV